MKKKKVLKIAILAEKYSPDPKWYVDVILKLITLAGDFVAEDIWHRVIQIITNNENLQEYAAETMLEVKKKFFFFLLLLLLVFFLNV